VAKKTQKRKISIATALVGTVLAYCLEKEFEKIIVFLLAVNNSLFAKNQLF